MTNTHNNKTDAPYKKQLTEGVFTGENTTLPSAELPQLIHTTSIPPKTNENYYKVPYGRGTNGIAEVAGHKTSLNVHTGFNEIYAEGSGFRFTVKEGYEGIIKSMPLEVSKLCCFTGNLLVAQNPKPKNNEAKVKQLQVEINLDDYLRACGKDVDPKLTGLKEADDREKARVKQVRSRGRASVKNALETLMNGRFEWKETIKGKVYSEGAANIVSRYEIFRGGHIVIEFPQWWVKRLIMYPLTYAPVGLLRLTESEIDTDVYRMGFKITRQAHNNTTVANGTNDRLKVKTLLKVTNIPTIEEVRQKRKSWRDRIFEPFDKRMYRMQELGIVTDWCYGYSNGELLDDWEIMNIDEDYETWSNLLIYYTLPDNPDHRRYLQDKAKRERKKKKSNKKDRQGS